MFDGILSRVSEMAETSEILNYRADLKRTALIASIVSTAFLVGAVGVVFFGAMLAFGCTSMGGAVLAGGLIIAGSLGGVISYDIRQVSIEVSKIADSAKNFLQFNYPDISGKEACINQMRKLLDQAFARTAILRCVKSLVLDAYSVHLIE